MNIKCFDNGGHTMGRYTVAYLDFSCGIVSNKGGSCVYQGASMNEEPFKPDGFCQHGEVLPGKHLGEEIKFEDLPLKCQDVIKLDLMEKSKRN